MGKEGVSYVDLFGGQPSHDQGPAKLYRTAMAVRTIRDVLYVYYGVTQMYTWRQLLLQMVLQA